MDFFESDLEDIVFNSPIGELRDRGFDSYFKDAHTYRQLNLGGYGIADIVQFKRLTFKTESGFLVSKIVVHVIELKKNQIGIDTFFQALRYCKGILEFIKKRATFDFNVTFNISLIGRKIQDSTDFVYLTDFLQNEQIVLNMYVYDYKIHGLSFIKKRGYYLINDNLNNKSLSYSKRIFTDDFPF